MTSSDRPVVRTLPAEPNPALERRLRGLSELLDNSIPIPGTRFRIGLDAIIGLLPGIGDVAGGLISGYIIMQAARFGLPKSTLVRMLFNVGVETVVGAVPLLGDLFDAGWKANTRNINLLREHLDRPRAAHASSRRFVAVLILALALLLVGAAWLAVQLVRLIAGAL